MQDADQTVLAQADYETGDSLNMNSDGYVNLWTTKIPDEIFRYVGKALRNATATPTSVTLLPGIDHSLCLERAVGNVNFVLAIGEEPYAPPPDGYWTNGSYSPEG